MTDSDDAEYGAMQAEQVAAYLRRGAIRGRLHQLGVAAFLLLVWALVGFLLATLESLYPGTGVVYSRPSEKPAVAEVEECRRVGPISTNGFGYWWHCRVRVHVEDGRVVETIVDRSVVTTNDVGKEVEFREACFGDNNTECTYGRPVNRAWGVAARALWIVERALLLFALIMSGVYVLRALLGVPRYFAIVNRLTRKRGEKGSPAGAE